MSDVDLQEHSFLPKFGLFHDFVSVFVFVPVPVPVLGVSSTLLEKKQCHLFP